MSRRLSPDERRWCDWAGPKAQEQRRAEAQRQWDALPAEARERFQEVIRSFVEDRARRALAEALFGWMRGDS